MLRAFSECLLQLFFGMCTGIIKVAAKVAALLKRLLREQKEISSKVLRLLYGDTSRRVLLRIMGFIYTGVPSDA